MSHSVFIPAFCVYCHKKFDFEQEYNPCPECDGSGCSYCYGNGDIPVDRYTPICDKCWEIQEDSIRDF